MRRPRSLYPWWRRIRWDVVEQLCYGVALGMVLGALALIWLGL
jgi:hypothetical protein